MLRGDFRSKNDLKPPLLNHVKSLFEFVCVPSKKTRSVHPSCF